jgi:hypothetical protein
MTMRRQPEAFLHELRARVPTDHRPLTTAH